MLSFLIEKGADVNAYDKYGQTALMLAAKYKSKVDMDIVKLLIEKGADVNARDNLDYTGLMTAAFDGRLDIVKLLIEKGVNINLRNKNDDTALSIARRALSMPVVYHEPDQEKDLEKIIHVLEQAGAK